MGETIGVNILKRARNMEISEQFDGYSGVRIFVGTNDDGENVIYESGDTNGRTLEIKNPFGTQEMADNILADIQGYQYQPMSAESALLNPAAEMGDGVTVNGVYSGVFVRATQFGRLMASDISAPTDEEIEHEFAVESPSERQYTRFVQQTRAMLKITNLAIEAEVSARTAADTAINATLSIQATQIAAKVSKQSPSGQTSFGWNLTDTSWTVFSGSTSNVILKATSSGLEVKGKITATSGTIGGFTIGSTSIYSNGMSSMSSTQTTGVHVGTDGIKLGQNFSVTTSGNVTANNMTLTGTLNVGGSNITASTLRQGAQEGYNWGSGGGSYGGYSSRGAYALAGADAGMNANKIFNTAVTLPNVTISGTFKVNNALTLWGFAAGYNKATVVTGITVNRQYSSELGMYVVNSVTPTTATIKYLEVNGY